MATIPGEYQRRLKLPWQIRRQFPHTPLGLKWRSSYWFTTFTVTLGIVVDLLVYTIIIPVMPFHLEDLGYNNVSSFTGWLLFAYSAGLVLATIPIAVFSERYSTRRAPLILGLLLLAASQILLMEAPTYAVMCVARILQGVSSSVVWVVGLALLCDVTPESLIGRHLGIAMGGLSMGSLIGPPVGGALYKRFGYRGPFIFGVIGTIFDLIARLLIIERSDALRWGFDPKELDSSSSKENPEEGEGANVNTGENAEQVKDIETAAAGAVEQVSSPVIEEQQKPRQLSLLAVMIKLAKSSRASIAFILTFIYGIVYTTQEPTLPLHLQQIWGLDSAKVGLVFLAAVIPTLFSAPITGLYTDKKGAEWVTFASLALALPWGVVIIIEGPLALFIVAYALEIFFVSGVISPITTELAHVAQTIDGVGYAHIYGVFNIAYGVGSAVGPLIGGQIYDHITRGWMALCLLNTVMLVVCIVLAAFCTGADPLVKRMRNWRFKLFSGPPPPEDTHS